MKLSFVPPVVPGTGALALGVLEGSILTPLGEQLDQASGGTLRRALEASARFKGQPGQTLALPVPAGLGLPPHARPFSPRRSHDPDL
ncbi:M17 family peptidase N-terminal domain-containing protein [Pararhodospirillum photometricum]|uniref:M17 family peptidase N-terminal domain-containing protein n=1 Tax=Pararhodospirillum photometricum TaxID=1084 RepID=UPI0002E93A9C|nr:M17 family peptidase N-terminal domain-containing protein [Pararhodospirillum photometricum]